jgi:hypothetical protein
MIAVHRIVRPEVDIYSWFGCGSAIDKPGVLSKSKNRKFTSKNKEIFLYIDYVEVM